MTDAQGVSQGQDTTSSPVPPSEPVASAPQSTPATNTEEKMLRQSEVNNLVARKKAEAVEEYKRLNATQPQYAQQKYGDGQPIQQPIQGNLQEQDIRRLAQDEFNRSRDEWLKEARTKAETEQAERTVKNFWSKMEAGKQKYQDFDKVVPSVEVLMSYPNVVQLLADHVDNTADIAYQLGHDLTKMEIIESMAQRNPRAAIQQMQRMSQSLKDNETAQSIKTPREPLSQMRPSNTGTDNGVMSVGDFRKKYKG